MTEKQHDFEIGKLIWPGISNTGGNASGETQNAVQQLVIELAQYVARTLEDNGISRFAFPLFKPFNALFGITRENVLVIASPLMGGLATMRFMDWQDAPGVSLEQATVLVRQQLGWAETIAFSIPSSLLYKDSSDRKHQLLELASNMFERIKGELQRQQRKATMQPIFRTSIEELDIDPDLCFILMPFRPEFDRIYETVIKTAIEETGLKALRADQVFSPTPIVEDIWIHIAKSRLIIADVTDKNPNVFYELGLAHAIGRPVIIVAQRKDDVPFDIAYIRYLLYTDNEVGWQKLKGDLVAALSSILGSSAAQQ